MREGDLPYLAEHLRGADVRELIAVYGHARVLEGLQSSVRSSEEALVGVGTLGDPVIVWGIARTSPTCALIWAVATPAITDYRTAFLRECRSVIRGWFNKFPEVQYLINFAHGDNKLHHRWLGWCGAEVLPEVPHGRLGEPFRPFVIRR